MTSPKQPLAEKHRDWYPYYAGFTQEFVSDVITPHVRNGSPILDPWNGSGTTTVVSTRHGLASTGLDISPALTIIARARVTSPSILESALPLGTEILEAAKRSRFQSPTTDLLTSWLRPSAAIRFPSIQSAIHSVLSDIPKEPGTSPN